MSSTDSPKLELGKKAVLTKPEKEEISTISETVPKGIKIKIIQSGQNVNTIASRVQINIQVQNRRNAYQRINKKLGEN